VPFSLRKSAQDPHRDPPLFLDAVDIALAVKPVLDCPACALLGNTP
jgi:hypothetical protein